ncbi:MAG: peptidase S9 [Bacteroides sp. SM23_62_1]|nr:MAG: peptidase S9 [Bacteroides sp. SM23_62_1]
MKIIHRFLVCLFIGIYALATSYSQESDPGLLTLERIFNSYEFIPDFFGPAKWMEDGSGYTTIEYSYSYDKAELVKYDVKSGARTLIMKTENFIPEGLETPIDIDDYSWSPDGNYLLLFANTVRVWRTNTKGDYWIYDLRSSKLRQLGAFADPSTLMFAKFSPDGKKVGYVVGNNIYVEDLVSKDINQLTDDGSATLINGTFDWVYEEEFGIQDGFRWSPDSKKIAYWQIDASGIGEFLLINNTDSLYPRITTIPYPKVGQTLPSARLGVIAVDGGKTVWMKTDGDPRNNYIPRMEWATSSEEIVFQYMNRLQNNNRVVLGDIKTGNIQTIHTETDDAWVDVVDDFQWIDDGRYFTWISEKSGWRHIYLISRDGKEIRQITHGNYDVISVELIDEKGGYIYFIASPDNPAQRFLFRVKIIGGGEPEKITTGKRGTHSYDLSPDAKWAFHTWSDFETPPVTELINLRKHKTERIIVENNRIKINLERTYKPQVEFFRIDIGEGMKLDGWIMKPYNFNASKKYPVLFYVYGEPAGSTVRDYFSGRQYLWYTMLTQKGYIIISIDNRGTNSPRGREWRKCIYKQIGIIAPADQAEAANRIGEWDFIDKERFAIWGWSGGGSMTLNALLQYPEIYHTGIAVASVPDQRLYDAIYQERYMHTPELNPDGFVKGSPITYAGNLKGNLLIIHGTGDDNVHYQGMEKLINEFVRYNKQFTMMAYPNRSHGIFEGEGTTFHLYTLMTNFLMEKMPPGGN